MSIRIMLADDHAVLLEGLRVLLDAHTDLEVVAEAVDVPTTVETARDVHPDVLVLDITMPGGSGLDVISTILTDCTQTRVLVLTMHADQSFLRAALQAGASGYLVKHTAGAELVNAIRTVHGGQSYISIPLADDMLQSVTSAEEGSESQDSRRALDALSPREREVLELVAYGYTNQAIADQIGVSVKTIESYRARLSEKLHLKSRVDLVRFALRAGLLGPEPRQ